MIPSSKAVRPARLLRSLALAAALCGVLFAASLVIAPPASAEDVTIWSAELEVKTLNAAQDELGCSESTPFNGQCLNSNVLSDDDFSLHGNAYTITRIEDDGSELELTLDTALPSNVLKFLTLHVGDDSELAFEDARVSSSNKRYTWSSSPSWSLDDDVDLSITDSSGPSLVKNTSLDHNERNLFENGHRSAQAFTAGTWARVTLIGIGIGDEVDDDVEVTLHKGGGNNPGDRLKTLENPSSITADSVNVFTVPDGGIVLEASKTYFVVIKTTSSDRVAVSVTGPLSGGNAEDAGAAENWTIDNDSWTNRPSIGAWQASNQSMRIDVKGQVLLDPSTNPSARAVAPMRVTLEWDRTLPSLTGTIDRDDGYKIEWSPDGSTSWTSLVNYTNQHGTFDIWCVCYPTRFNDDTIAPGTTRHYRVKAVDDDDESPWSGVVSATTPALVDSDGGLVEFGAVVSELDALNDQKVFRIGLESGEYRFMIRGKAPKHRVIVTDAAGTETWNDVLEANNTLIPRFTTQAVGEHQVKISHGGSPGQYTSLNAGWFQFQLVPVSDPAVGTLSLPDTPNLSAVLNTYGDVDRAELAVQPGKAYAVRGRGRETAGGTAATPRIKRARPPSTNHEYNMGKPWVDGVTIAKASPLCHNFSEPEKCEFQAFVIDLRGQTGAEQTWQIIVAPTARPRTWPYPAGTYLVDLRELLPSQLAGVRMPLRAWFASQPTQHDGSERIKVRVAFSDAVDESPENVGEHSVSVDGGEVTSVRPVDGLVTGSSEARKGARSAGGQEDDAEDEEVVWEFEIEPDANRDVTVSLEAWRPCDEPGAICTADSRALSKGISTTVPSSLPLTASFQDVPEAHDGESTFTFRTMFSDNIGISFRSLREDAFTVTGGTVTRGRRVDDQRDLFEITVRPDSNGDLTITLPAGRDCATSGAICTKGENRRQLTNSPSATVAGPPNTAATGAPTISGTPQVGETLTADKSGIADPDGLANATYSYQWLADDTDIKGATGSTYTLVAADENKAIKVEVSFTDDADNEETLTSAATAAVAAAPTPNSPATGAPTINYTAQVGETLTADKSGIADADGLTNATYSYQWLADDAAIAGATGWTYILADTDEGKAITVQVSFTDDAGNDETLTSAATNAVDARPNSPATGAPAISGTAQVGETLTGNTSGVADADGLSNVQYEYQWLSDDADISGATNATYTLVAADEGKAIKVEVSFTDDADNEESLTSAATDAVAAAPQTNSPATGAPTISGTAQVGETLTANTSEASPTSTGLATSSTSTSGWPTTPKSRVRPTPPTPWSPKTKARPSRFG